MYHFKNKDRITIYENSARDMTVVQGNSTVIYPFYKSSGHNSQSDQTWFPWMGYFDLHPGQKNQLYMVKPNTQSMSASSIAIIQKYLGAGDKATNFISRMGNDEALAISCSLGGGEWHKYPKFREEIITADATKSYIKLLELESVKKMVLKAPKTNAPVSFKGKGCSGEAMEVQAAMATAMENVVSKETPKFVSAYSVQDKKRFPKTNELAGIAELSHAKAIRDSYISKLSSMKKLSSPQPQDSEALKSSVRLGPGK
ncbi:hypothetical protein [Legionella fallonii]|uniref:Uncharacterized protein n=1 Tax=Legionella fallonii LLAP-10 TaxID=1212491 RepID=A0A098GAG6_9GAMM|nr:hypothetical protein [Legionella fallonii]CEG59015.1 protein of unknown function [Legionella fallonii LLAP-10]